MVGFLLFIIFLLYLYYYYIRYGHMGRLLYKIPGPKLVPIFGNILLMLMVDTSELWSLIEAYYKFYFPIYRLSGLHIAGVILQDPDDIETLLSSPKYIEKSFFYQYLQGWLKFGLLTSKGRKWFHRRKLLTSAFHYNVLTKYGKVMSDHGKKLVNSLKEECDNKPIKINLIPFVTKHTLSIICETAMGTPINEDDGGRSKKYVKSVYDIGQIVVYRFMRIWNLFLLNNFTFNYFTFTGWKHQKIVKFLHSFSSRIIAERKKYHEETNGQYLKEFDVPSENQNDKDESDDAYMKIKRRRMAMLDILISSQRKNEIDDEGIREEVDTFIFEGHDTSAMALSFAIYLLAEHKDIQTKARKEVDEICEEANGEIGTNEVSKMFYLERCIKETLRLFPSVPFVSRVLREDLQLKNYIAPKGVNIAVLIYDLHRDDHFWPDPLRYDPDRFLPEEVAKRHPYCYIPFSAGPRNCIGQKFAMMELKMICAYILRNFYLDCTGRHHDIRRRPDLIMRPQQDVYATFTPRKI